MMMSLLLLAFAFSSFGAAIGWGAGVGALPAYLGARAALPLAVLDAGGWIVAAAAGLTAITTILIFIRRESRMQEPKQEHSVSGGPVTIRHEEIYVERHEHTGLRNDLEHHKREIWEVVKGLRSAVGRIETSTSNTEVLREANGVLLSEVREEVSSLGKLVARLTAIVETKLEAKHK